MKRAPLVLLAVLTAGCSLFGQQGYTVSSAAMEPTLKQGSHVTARLTGDDYAPKPGDIVVFSAPEWGETDAHIFRVIGVPGSTVACCDERGRLTVDRRPLDEPYIGNADPSALTFSLTVPPGRLWVLGDNRGKALDSRAHQGDRGVGTIAVANVIGVVDAETLT
ncbi:signal peptidase I [Nonomuraea guangzhouensis]|uniref:Signal peptidase I n=1 Tax=Nonomuraea guangzhouensis TaxID=1291555 RepID=A0ABW4G2Q9_9ACTN|nr:signal peptidase I [Nonomuraea guangzhouensis]